MIIAIIYCHKMAMLSAMCGHLSLPFMASIIAMNWPLVFAIIIASIAIIIAIMAMIVAIIMAILAIYHCHLWPLSFAKLWPLLLPLLLP